MSPITNLINLQSQLQKAFVASERLNDILESEIEHIEKGMIFEGLKSPIIFKDVDFRYGYKDIVLNSLNIEIKKGSKIAIVGECGCGKTTTVKLLMALYEYEAGNIIINGYSITEYSKSSLRSKIAYVSQEAFLFSDSIYNNLRLGNEDISNEDIEKMCKICFMDKFIRNLPCGYETILEENGNNLSGGQKQKLLIARALLRKPEILILDEATSDLDSITENGIEEIISDFLDDITCIIITHRLKIVKKCDCIFVMKDGKVVEHGTHMELIKKNGLYNRFISNPLSKYNGNQNA